MSFLPGQQDYNFISIRTATVSMMRNKDDWREEKLGHAYIEDNRPSKECIRGSMIWMRPRSGETDMARFNYLLHEMGHALGLDHSDYPGTIMYRQVSRKYDIKLGKDTQKELKQLYGEQ